MARSGWKIYTDKKTGKLCVKGKCGSCGNSMNGMTVERANAHYERCAN